MTSVEPTYEVTNGTLRVQLMAGDVASQLSFDCVLDLTGMGEIVGVEILDFRRQLDNATVATIHGGSAIRCSYDPEHDAFYLHVAHQHAPIQKKASGVALLDGQRHLIGVEVTL